jgi:hypothetical protein
VVIWILVLEAYVRHSRVMAGRGIKCPHINSISDLNQADVQRAKEVSIVTNPFLITRFYFRTV